VEGGLRKTEKERESYLDTNVRGREERRERERERLREREISTGSSGVRRAGGSNVFLN